jgi:hypothetical protein
MTEVATDLATEAMATAAAATAAITASATDLSMTSVATDLPTETVVMTAAATSTAATATATGILTGLTADRMVYSKFEAQLTSKHVSLNRTRSLALPISYLWRPESISDRFAGNQPVMASVFPAGVPKLRQFHHDQCLEQRKHRFAHE